MLKKNTLFVGYGDLARRVRAHLTPSSGQVAICRRASEDPTDLEYWCANATDHEVLNRLEQQNFSQVLLTLTPKAATPEGYREAYVDVVEALLKPWRHTPPDHVVLVSSTSVYGQSNGEWVDESSPCEPSHFSGEALLAAEQLLVASGLPYTIVRPAGIYGPGRDFLQRQVRAGKAGGANYTNRIHVDDAAAFIAALMASEKQGPWGLPAYNLCDDEPALSSEVRTWLAQQMGVPAPSEPAESTRAGSKRIGNKAMRATGFELRYPSFREGYQALLASSA